MKSIFIILLALLPVLGVGQTTVIPNPIFEQTLIDLGNDEIIKGSTLTANVITITVLKLVTEFSCSL